MLYMYNSAEMRRNVRGFTLVELSIVLVIIGLIVGGIVGGQSLISSARLSSTVSKFTSIKTQFNAFQLQYDALPGDFSEATDYWPTSGTDSGDGDGKIEWTTEVYGTFGHMRLAGISQYNSWWPESPIAGAFFTLGTSGTTGLSKVYTRGGVRIALGGESISTKVGPILTVKDVITMDKKIDDGVADKGDFRAGGTGVGCATTVGVHKPTGTYQPSVGGNVCTAYYFLQ